MLQNLVNIAKFCESENFRQPVGRKNGLVKCHHGVTIAMGRGAHFLGHADVVERVLLCLR
jgi:hypothetical protein